MKLKIFKIEFLKRAIYQQSPQGYQFNTKHFYRIQFEHFYNQLELKHCHLN